ncbi:hypothetical protein J560_3862 [Acinetobacter baumannii 855125]|nr:hypothetical protein J560_3862 [Acinetobacter baumannii 855125]
MKKPLECAHGVWHICDNLAILHLIAKEMARFCELYYF